MAKKRWPGLAEAFYDPLGSYNDGSFGAAIGGHSDHVHVSDTDPQGMLRAITYAQQLGLAVRENPYVDKVDPVHVQGSYHYRTFPGSYNGKQLGEAVDVSGSPDLMAQYYRTVTGSEGQSTPMAYTPGVAQALGQTPAPQANSPATAPLAAALSKQPQTTSPDPRQQFAQALAGAVGPTGQLDQAALLQALIQRRQAMR